MPGISTILIMRATQRAPKPAFCCARFLEAQDDQFGRRSINPMELYHNQVLLWTTRREGKRLA